MSAQVVPTKSNLLAAKKSLNLSRTGYELMDRKRNILIREMMALIDRASALQDSIDVTYEEPIKPCRWLILPWVSLRKWL